MPDQGVESPIGEECRIYACRRYRIARDERFPIRATVQFYQATDTPQLLEQDLERMSATIHRVYTASATVGSLVTAGWTGRTTEPSPGAQEPVWPQPWYAEPCRAYTAATGRPWEDGLARIRERLGAGWTPAHVRELQNALALVR